MVSIISIGTLIDKIYYYVVVGSDDNGIADAMYMHSPKTDMVVAVVLINHSVSHIGIDLLDTVILDIFCSSIHIVE